MHDGLALDASLTMDDDIYSLKTTAETRDDDSVTFSIMNQVIHDQRPCNLGAVVTGMPILMPIQWLDDGSPFYQQLFRETSAHEFGHSVLRDERDHDWSITHKGSTGGALDQNVKASQPVYPSSGEIDLMQYWNDPTVPFTSRAEWEAYYSEERTREIVCEDDARGLVSVAQVEFKPR
jgi:hypothetical protein